MDFTHYYKVKYFLALTLSLLNEKKVKEQRFDIPLPRERTLEC